MFLKSKLRSLIASISLLFVSNSIAVDFDNNPYKIKSKFSQECMELRENSNKEGIKIVQYPCSKDETQKFILNKNQEGLYSITTSSGKKVTLNPKGYYITQSSKGSFFKIEQLEDSYTIQESTTEEYVTANVRSNDILKSEKNNQYSQMWYLFK